MPESITFFAVFSSILITSLTVVLKIRICSNIVPQPVVEYNTESFLDWGKTLGHSTLIVVKHFLYTHKVEQQGYKACASLMKLADHYGTERLENACAKALSYTPSPSLKNISSILKNG